MSTPHRGQSAISVRSTYHPSNESSRVSTQEFDFGTVLAQGQTLRHEFTLTNPTARPIHLLKAIAYTPCCSAIEEPPQSIDAGGEAKIKISLKPGLQSGNKRVLFEVVTDSEDRPIRKFAVSANILPVYEITLLEGSDNRLRLGQGGKQIFRVLCRRREGEGRTLPGRIEVAAPLQAAFKGAASEKPDIEGWVESTRDVEVVLPPSSKAGAKRSEMFLQWPDGYSQPYPVSWVVSPCITVNPPGFVLHAFDAREPKLVTLTSDDRTFRVTKIVGARLLDEAASKSAAAKNHRLQLRFDPATTDRQGASNVEFLTDHPHQPVVTLSVLTLQGDQE
jgi:hypothetical protein